MTRDGPANKHTDLILAVLAIIIAIGLTTVMLMWMFVIIGDLAKLLMLFFYVLTFC